MSRSNTTTRYTPKDVYILARNGNEHKLKAALNQGNNSTN